MLRHARHSEIRAHRLDSVLCNIIFIALLLLASVSVIGFVITHTHVFYVAYTTRIQREQNAAWLVQQCKSPEFYSNMKHHASLCDDVTLAEADAIWLHALRDVFETISVCGTVTCEERVLAVINFAFGRGLFTISAVLACLFILMLLFIPCYRVYMAKMAYAYHAPFYPPHSQLQSDTHWRSNRAHALYPQLDN